MMAIFGKFGVVKNQVKSERFSTAFEYLAKVLDSTSVESQRLQSLPMDSFVKIELDKDNFALEQVYYTKERKDCFFESHRDYIDVQFILEGEEIIELESLNCLNVSSPYTSDIDLIKYEDIECASILVLKKGDVAIFYPEDGHMPGLKISDSKKLIKTVVKVKV